MPWIKITDHWDSGHNTTNYQYVHDERSVQQAITEARLSTNDENNWSDKYRGCDVEPIDAPPLEWLEDEIAVSKSRLESLIRYHDILTGYKEKTYG